MSCYLLALLLCYLGFALFLPSGYNLVCSSSIVLHESGRESWNFEACRELQEIPILILIIDIYPLGCCFSALRMKQTVDRSVIL